MEEVQGEHVRRLPGHPISTIAALRPCCPLWSGTRSISPLPQHEGLPAPEAQALPRQHPGPRLRAPHDTGAQTRRPGSQPALQPSGRRGLHGLETGYSGVPEASEREAPTAGPPGIGASLSSPLNTSLPPAVSAAHVPRRQAPSERGGPRTGREGGWGRVGVGGGAGSRVRTPESLMRTGPWVLYIPLDTELRTQPALV